MPSATGFALVSVLALCASSLPTSLVSRCARNQPPLDWL